MSIEQEILGLPEGQEFTVKELSLRLDCSSTALYKPLGNLVEQGVVQKGKKLSRGKFVACYSIPARQVVSGCQWEVHKEMLIASKQYPRGILDNNYWPFLDREIKVIRLNKETFDILLTGLKGFGKSVTAIWLCRHLDRYFNLKRNVLLRKDQILKLAITQPFDMSLVIDDIGNSLDNKNCSERDRRIIFDFFDICRQNRVDLVGTTPHLDLVDINFRRLIRYVWNLELKCEDESQTDKHAHIVVSRALGGSPPKFQPVGVFKMPYFTVLDSLVKQYDQYKLDNLRGAAKDSLEELQKAEEGVKRYIETHSVTSITTNVLLSAIRSVGLTGSLSKTEKETLQVAMYNALQEKKARAKEDRQRQISQGKKNLQAARKKKTCHTKLAKFIDQGRSDHFAERCSYYQVYDQKRSANLKNILPKVQALWKKVRPELLESIILYSCHDIYLAKDLRVCRDLISQFKGFDPLFYRKLFAYLYFERTEAIPWAKRQLEERSWDFYKVKGKFSAKKWRESTDFVFAMVEDRGREAIRTKRKTEKDSEAIAAILDLAYMIFHKGKSAGVTKQLECEHLQKRKQEPVFWADLA